MIVYDVYGNVFDLFDVYRNLCGFI